MHDGGDDLVELFVEINVDAREDRRRPRGTACKKDEHEKQKGEQAQARGCLHGRPFELEGSTACRRGRRRQKENGAAISKPGLTSALNPRRVS